MGRQRNVRPVKRPIVLLVDGQDEKWYLEKVRERYKPEVLKKVKILPELATKKNPDIYVRLGGDVALVKARKNYIPFDKENCENMGFSEMAKVFDFFDTLS